MIIQPFTVRSREKDYRLVDRDLLDSELQRRLVNKMQAAALDYAQEGGKCKARGLPDRQELDNRVLAVFDASELLGIFMLGSIAYVSGPWADLQSWKVTAPGADVILTAVPMPGVLTMAKDVEEDFAVEVVALMLRKRSLGMVSGQGLPVGLDMLHYGILKELKDPISVRAQGQHAKIKADRRLLTTEEPHPTIRGTTVVEVRAK